MLAATGINMYTVESRTLHCGFKDIGRKKRNTTDACFKNKRDKTRSGSKSKHSEGKMWHISNQMPYLYVNIVYVYIKYSKLFHGFKSVPRKKGHF